MKLSDFLHVDTTSHLSILLSLRVFSWNWIIRFLCIWPVMCDRARFPGKKLLSQKIVEMDQKKIFLNLKRNLVTHFQ